MKFLFTFILFAISPIAFSQFCYLPEEIENSFSKSMNEIRPSHAIWIRSTASRASDGKLEPSGVHQEAARYGVLNSLNNNDIDALVFLVMMQASKDAQKDIKDIMSKIKSSNEKKAKLREALTAIKGNKIRYNSQIDSLKLASGLVKQQPRPSRAVALKPVSKVELDTITQEINNEMDSLGEMGEMDMLTLQKYFDQITKIQSMISNIMKKSSGNISSMVSNLK